MRKITQEVSKLKMDFERAYRRTNLSLIVNKVSERTHNKKAGLGFYKKLLLQGILTTFIEILDIL